MSKKEKRRDALKRLRAEKGGFSPAKQFWLEHNSAWFTGVYPGDKNKPLCSCASYHDCYNLFSEWIYNETGVNLQAVRSHAATPPKFRRVLNGKLRAKLKDELMRAVKTGDMDRLGECRHRRTAAWLYW